MLSYREVENYERPWYDFSHIQSGLKRLFELEVPEIFWRRSRLKSVARETGMRSKIAVYSRDENIDPVGACVGPKEQRVPTYCWWIAMKNRRVKWDEDPAIYIY